MRHCIRLTFLKDLACLLPIQLLKSQFKSYAFLLFLLGFSILFIGAYPAQKGTAKIVRPLSLGPISYYEQRCARCHGTDGSMHDKKVWKGITVAKLRHDIKRMADGPARAPLSELNLKVQVAYYWAIIGEQPFIAWTSQEGNKLTGEVSYNAKVMAQIGKRTLPVKQIDEKWTIEVPKGTKANQVILIALTPTAKTVLPLLSAAYSHSRGSRNR